MKKKTKETKKKSKVKKMSNDSKFAQINCHQNMFLQAWRWLKLLMENEKEILLILEGFWI